MTKHNGYKTLNATAVLAQLHPSTARIAADEDGLLPEFVIYFSLVSTAKVFLQKVCQLCFRASCRLVRRTCQVHVLLCKDKFVMLSYAGAMIHWLS
jgi:hypothetical protein